MNELVAAVPNMRLRRSLSKSGRHAPILVGWAHLGVARSTLLVLSDRPDEAGEFGGEGRHCHGLLLVHPQQGSVTAHMRSCAFIAMSRTAGDTCANRVSLAGPVRGRYPYRSGLRCLERAANL